MIDFIKYKKVCLLMSFVALAIGVVGYLKHGGFSYGVDFTGGTEIRVIFDSSVDIAKLREVVGQDQEGFSGSSIQNVDGDRQFIVKVSETTQDVQSRFEKIVTKTLNVGFKIESVEQVGPEAGKEVRWNTIFSVMVVLIALLLYIALRHRYDYAVGAVLSLGHDLLVLLSFYLIYNEPITVNILAAVLSMLGYSLNDTIVVFNRIKNNVKTMGGASREEIVNVSINQTLRRTILTSFATFVSMFALYFFGGEVLRGFSLTMMVAVVVGTYSSIYIASPVMLLFNSERGL